MQLVGEKEHCKSHRGYRGIDPQKGYSPEDFAARQYRFLAVYQSALVIAAHAHRLVNDQQAGLGPVGGASSTKHRKMHAIISGLVNGILEGERSGTQPC